MDEIFAPKNSSFDFDSELRLTRHDRLAGSLEDPTLEAAMKIVRSMGAMQSVEKLLQEFSLTTRDATPQLDPLTVGQLRSSKLDEMTVNDGIRESQTTDLIQTDVLTGDAGAGIGEADVLTTQMDLTARQIDESAIGINHNTVNLNDLVIQLRPDLVGNYLNVIQEPRNAGDGFDVQFQVKNQGIIGAGNFTVNFYLSDNDYISGSPTFDRYLGSYNIGSLAAGSTTGTLTTTMNLPAKGDSFWDSLGDGTYYIGMSVDANNTVAETNESNNQNQGWLVDYDDVLINDTKVVDLKGNYLNVLQEPRDAGEIFDVQFRIDNLGTNLSDDFAVKFYLSKNDHISTADRYLGTYNVNGIAGGGGSGLLSTTLALPEAGNAFWDSLGDGTYHIGMIVDANNDVVEVNEGNNRNQGWLVDSDDVPIHNTKLVDLSGEYFNVIQEPRNAGQSVDVEFRLQNTQANSSGSFDVDFYISTNDYISNFDHYLGSYSVSNIAENSLSSTLVANLALPVAGDDFWKYLGDGTYHIGMIVDGDNTVTETNESNNSNIAEFDDYDGVQINQTNVFQNFNISDASGDSTSSTVFEDGVLDLDYDWSSPTSLANLSVEVLESGTVIGHLGNWSDSTQSNTLINLADFDFMDAGTYEIRAIAETTDGEYFSNTETITVIPWTRTNGTFAANTLAYAGAVGGGAVFLGRGGTDTLTLASINQADVSHINGLSIASFNPWAGSTNQQAIFGGTAFDYITLNDGREIYFQGIETLAFDDGEVDLLVSPNDTYFGQQWNLHVSDVDSAWRFTRGSTGVILASLDTGVLVEIGDSGSVTDLSLGRLITDASDDDNYNPAGHGHQANSVMASTANNGFGVAGINWNSSVYVNDVYNGVNLQQAISDTIAYARANNKRVVFQGGIQGEGWLTSGGTQAQLEQLINNNDDIALFAVAAGNGGPGGNLNDPNYLTSVSGVAKLQTNHENVISVGALTRTGTATVDGLTNASSVDIASYSNRGSNLTLMAATNSPSMHPNGNMQTFGGTSCANPNMAGIASLVWSVNANLDGGQVRDILTGTAMDLGDAGRDNTFGHGLVNADAAVRRAWALNRNADLANLYGNDSLFA